MKKNAIALLCLLTITFALDAQQVTDRASYKINIGRSLWYNSSNASGLARDGALQWRDISLGYGLQTGSFTDSWGAGTQQSYSLGGDMLMDIAGFKLAAVISLERDALSDCKYNASLPAVSWDMPFFVALNSTESFGWSHNKASIDIKASTPLMMDDMLSAGLAVRFDGCNAAKGSDPLCQYDGIDIEVAPAVSYAISEENIVGLTLRYRAMLATSTLTPATGSASAVAFLQGLGAFTPRSVGGVLSMGPVLYQASRYGLNLQYNHLGEASSWLLEFSFDKGSTMVIEQEKTQGSVDKFVTGFDIQGLFGENRNRKLTLGFHYNLNYWLNSSSGVIGSGNFLDAKLDYTIYTRADKGSGYDFELGAGVDFGLLSAVRYVPDGILSHTGVLPYLFLGKNISLGQGSNLLVRFDAGYNFTAKNNYDYDGSWSSAIVKYMYDDEADYLNTYYVKLRGGAEYSLRLGGRMSAYAKLNADLLKPMGISGNRLLAGLSVGVLF